MDENHDLISVELNIPSLGDSEAGHHLVLALSVQRKYPIPKSFAKQFDLLYQHFFCAEIVHNYLNHDKRMLLPEINPRTTVRTQLPDFSGACFDQLKSDLLVVYNRFGISSQDQRALMYHYRFCMMWKLQMCYARNIAKHQCLN